MPPEDRIYFDNKKFHDIKPEISRLNGEKYWHYRRSTEVTTRAVIGRTRDPIAIKPLCQH